MSFNQGLLIIMGIGALLGGGDHLLGNRFGLGKRFEEAFQLLGPIALSMSGIICLAPLLSVGLSGWMVPLFRGLGLDPGMFGGILPIDMGGYQLAVELADRELVGKFSGILVAATFGCTLIFTIPVGLGTIPEEDRPLFTRGILLGLLSLPAGLLLGGLVCGLSPRVLAVNLLPILLSCCGLFAGMRLRPDRIAAFFQWLSRWIQRISIAGLALAAFSHLSGWQILPGMTPLADAMEVACSIAIVMLGSMPLAELFQIVMHAPLSLVRRHTGLAMFSRMDPRGKVVSAAFLVCGASAFAAHLGFTMAVAPDMSASLLLGKLAGGLVGLCIALTATRDMDKIPGSV